MGSIYRMMITKSFCSAVPVLCFAFIFFREAEHSLRPPPEGAYTRFGGRMEQKKRGGILKNIRGQVMTLSGKEKKIILEN